MERRGRMTHWGFAVLVVALIATCTLGTAWRYAAVTVANAVPLAVLLVLLPRPPRGERAGWPLLLLGTAVLAVHNVDNQVALAGTGAPAAGPFAATTLALGYVLLLAGGAATTAVHARHDRGGMLDAAVIGLAAASIMWGVALYPAHVRRGSSPGTIAYEMSLVLFVTALAGMVVRIAWVAREARATTLYLLLAICTASFADVAFTFTLNPSTGLSAWWASGLCTVSLIAFAAALAHPALDAIATARRPPAGLTRWRLAFLGAALATNPALAGMERLLRQTPDAALLSAGSLLMVPLVVARIGLLARRQAEAERRLRDLASQDDLTGLPNRRAFVVHLEALLERSALGAAPGIVVLYLDLDDFKVVNDTYGHAAGDCLLRSVADRIRACVGPGDLVARLGGDEFVVALQGDCRTTAATAAAIELALSAPVAIGSVVASGRASIGLSAIGAGVRADAETLLARADQEMYRAKRSRQERAEPPPAAYLAQAAASVPAPRASL